MGMGVSAVRAEQTGAGIPYRRLDKSVYGDCGKQYKSQEARSHVDGHRAFGGYRCRARDTITVSGFPADHGQYAGNEEYEFAADRPYATVSVWWSGDPDNPSNDGAYKPSGGEVPTEDDNHRLLATWEIPAMNGTFKIGAGALDAHGAPMYLTAERPGWYVFVWRFEGDDRVSPASSPV